ncbi:tail fiber domain-containing protein [Dyadobacter aurulentus]|uniref:tail fiber domain-containing protein n=1 Tax=Dyadobacter sp. UC 10 TaxID=2605428 RepID=UPI0011F0EBBB|nr:tail fiber domain-containing protein [Dyadobacter sp. UC 10]KAA0990073.1 hypothetical protein FXO21_07825 [Dyadobacter sp. UC 10]
MKTSFLSLLFLLSFRFVAAQAPESFNFQGVARGADGKLVKNIITRLRITIHSENLSGPVAYSETHRPSTNEHGIFTIAVGKGLVESGEFNKISWGTVSHFIHLELDPAGGTEYVDLGSTQLLSVPYAAHAKEAGQWRDGTPVVQTMKIGSEVDVNDPNPDPNDPKVKKYYLPDIGDGATLIWYPVKGSFRAGNADGGKWNDGLMGKFSFAAGTSTEASGLASAAFGISTKASVEYSLATGLFTESTASGSATFGAFTKAQGAASAAFGQYTVAKTRGSFVAGLYNNASDFPDPDNEKDDDRIFQIGNGDSEKRLNALTLLRNGNLGLGKDVLEPKYILDIGGRPRVRHIGTATAGIYLDDSENKERGFVGMRTDDQIGFYLDTWKFWVNTAGNAVLLGNLTQTSDARLKHKLSPITESLAKVTGLAPYHYYWKDPEREQNIQTGLIAQEVEKLFPELVKADAQGYKSVNYIGLIPHLIDSVKELNKKNELLTSQNQLIQEQNVVMIRKLEAMEARLNESEFPKTAMRTK